MKRTRREISPSDVESSSASAYDINDPPINSAQWWYYIMQKNLSESRVGKVKKVATTLTFNPGLARVSVGFSYEYYTRLDSMYKCHSSVAHL
tara:strand:- start:278 stop:553 length:276 start_codon:yes stop_codon:yes gene_type:complete